MLVFGLFCLALKKPIGNIKINKSKLFKENPHTYESFDRRLIDIVLGYSLLIEKN